MKTLLIAAALLVVPAAPAFAQDSTIVRYAPGELTTAAGRASLQRRLKQAVVRVCGPDGVAGSTLPNAKVRACYKTAAEAARPQVDRAIALASRGAEVASRNR